jgi:hypothetical protein
MTEKKTVRIVYDDDGSGLRDRLRAAYSSHNRKPFELPTERPLREVLDENRARIAEIIERERWLSRWIRDVF